VIEHDRRRVQLAGIIAYPAGDWVTQQARNLFMELGYRVDRLGFLIRDRDSKFTTAFDAVLTGADIRIIRTPIRAARANAIAERFIGQCVGNASATLHVAQGSLGRAIRDGLSRIHDV